MTAKSEVLDKIRRAFSIWATDIKQSSKVNRLADNISSEDIAAGLLNLIYGYNLRNANEGCSNQKAIDLADSEAEDEAGVAVQISSTNSRPKAIKTMNSFCEGSFGQRLCDEYSKLIFLIISTDEKFKDWDKLSSDEFTLSILNLVDLSKYIEHFPLEKLEQILEYLQRELKLESGKSDDSRQNISRIATILDADTISQSEADFTEDDAEKFYMVDLNFPLMLHVVCKGRDIPHDEMNARLLEICASGKPAILTGYSGTGKSVIMLRTAVSWVRSGGIALWLSLTEDMTLTDAEAQQFYKDVLQILPTGQRALLCLDGPSQWSNAFRALANNWNGNDRLQLLLAVRVNRLSRMTDANADLLHHWFDGATVAALMFENKHNPLRVKDYPVEYIPETYQRKLTILKKSVAVMFRRGVVRKVTETEAVKQITKEYYKNNVSLVELIYRAQFWLKDFASHPEKLRMDWDEWKQILKNELGINKKATQLYGIIALCSVFEVPITLSLFCRHFDAKPSELVEAINKWRMQRNAEPVLYREGSGTLLPKHDVAAELFFLFHRDTLPVNELMAELLETMQESEIEDFLKKNTGKAPLQNGFKSILKNIRYRDYMMTIYRRNQGGTCGLLPSGKAQLALGLLYTVPYKNRSLGEQTLSMVERLDPVIDGTVLTASLYTEWGRLLADLGRKTEAEEKFRAVICVDSKNIHSRTELGRLLAKQPGREDEAEKFLREAIRIDPKNLHPHTELGRLLAKQPGREDEAEKFLREAIRIDPKNLHPHTELGRLLAKQPGREKEAEQLLQETIKIKPKDIQSRTELGRLLAKQPGRETEAEQFLREAMQIDSKHIQSRTELGRLLARQPGREKEAEQLLQETIKITPKDIQSRTELGRLLAKQPGRENEAEKFLREAIRIDPKNLHPHTELGRLLAQQPGRKNEAEQFLREAIRIDPKNLHPHTELGRLLAKQPGREDEAEQFLREAIRIDPENLHPRIELAKIHIKNHQFSEAERLYQEVLKIDPGNHFARDGLKNLMQLTSPTP